MFTSHPLPAEMVFSQGEALRKAQEKIAQIKPRRNVWIELLVPILSGLALGYAAYVNSGSFYIAAATSLAFAAYSIVLSLWHSNRRLEELLDAQMVILKDLQAMQNAAKLFGAKS